MPEHFRKGRAFSLGDAAHIHSPAGGQGMNTGRVSTPSLAGLKPQACRSMWACIPRCRNFFRPNGNAGEAVGESLRRGDSAVGPSVEGDCWQSYQPAEEPVERRFVEFGAVAAMRKLSPSRSHKLPNFAPQIRTAFSSMVSNTG